MSSRQESRFSFPVKQGVVHGVGAFVLSYALTYGLYLFELSQKSSDFSEAFYSKFEVAGWLLYAAHTVKFELSVRTTQNAPMETYSGHMLEGLYAAFQAETVTDLTGMQESVLMYFFGSMGAASSSMEPEYSAGTFGEITNSMVVPKLAFYAVPVLVLAAAGYRLTRTHFGEQHWTGKERVLAGATIAIGYAVLTFVAAMTVFDVSTSERFYRAVKPATGASMIAMACVYPAVAGGLGGYLTSVRE